MPRPRSEELQCLLDEEPFVRSLARALAGQDADEVVQRTWLRAIADGAGSIRRPRLWLARVVRSVASNLRRSTHRREKYERATPPPDLVPSSAELMEREERRRELVTAVDQLGEPERTVVLLRYFQDLPPRTIATQLGLPTRTVYARLHRALSTLRQRLDREHGDSRAWLLPLLPTPNLAAAVTTGVLAMTTTTKAKATVVAGVLALGLFGLWMAQGIPSTAPTGPSDDDTPAPMTADLPLRVDEDEQPAMDRLEVVPPAAAVVPRTGTLVITARYAGDDEPVPDLVVMVGESGADHRIGTRRARTNAEGVARFEGLAPGRIRVQDVRSDHIVGAEVIAGVERRIDYALPRGIVLRGVVVDRSGVPVPRAGVYIVPLARADRDCEHVADTTSDGRFVLRSCPTKCYVGARAAGHAPSRLQFLHLADGATKDVLIELPAHGGSLEGVVLGPAGQPVRDAVILVGKGPPRGGIPIALGGVPSRPAVVRSDAEGRFHVLGLDVGQNPVWVRAAGLAPWRGTCEVHAHATTRLDVVLALGVTCTGTVVDADDEPVGLAEVSFGTWQDFAHSRTSTTADGYFRLDGLPPGELVVRAEHSKGKAIANHVARSGDILECNLRLVPGLSLHGRVLTTDDTPVARAWVGARAEPSETQEWWSSGIDTDNQGVFEIANCPEGATLTLSVRGPGIRPKRFDDITPPEVNLVLRVEAAPPPTARFVGKIVAHDGRPVPEAKVSAHQRDGARSSVEVTSEDGGFQLGPVVPGAWQLGIWAEGHPRVLTEWRALAADSTCDVGTIMLPPGGRVRVCLRGGAGLHPALSLVDSTSAQDVPFTDEGMERLSEPVAPGSYSLRVSGRGIAAQRVPVVVQANQETDVAVDVQPGHRQSFRIDAPRPLSERRVCIRRGDELVVDSTLRSRVDWAIPAEWACSLATGTYSIAVTGDGLAGTANFVVKEGTNEVVRVELR